MIKEIHKIIVIEPNSFPVDSCMIRNKKLDGAIFVYDMETNDADVQDSTKESLLKSLESCFNHNPDGVLVWIPKNYQSSFIHFTMDFITEKNKKNELNFDNGSIAEAVGFHYLEKGILVEMIDPECDSTIFSDLLNQFYEKENIYEDGEDELDLNQVFSYQGYHLFSALKERNNENAKFYDLIKTMS